MNTCRWPRKRTSRLLCAANWPSSTMTYTCLRGRRAACCARPRTARRICAWTASRWSICHQRRQPRAVLPRPVAEDPRDSSFNEWPETTVAEPSSSWSDPYLYLKILAEWKRHEVQPAAAANSPRLTPGRANPAPSGLQPAQGSSPSAPNTCGWVPSLLASTRSPVQIAVMLVLSAFSRRPRFRNAIDPGRRSAPIPSPERNAASRRR